MSAQFLSLDRWAMEVYGECAPTRRTLIRWAKQSLIQPAPQKHGRSYFVVPWARYGTENEQTDKMPAPPAAIVPSESALSLLEKMLRERKAVKKS